MTFTSDPPSGARGAEADMIINGRYAIERQLDQGGMGTIFLAKDLQAFDKRVAIKLILDQPREARWLARFEQEARLTAQLNSPHIVNLREFGQTAQGEPFIVMDFLEGENLAQHLIRHPVMPLELAVRITDEILAGLEDMHALGIIHRDIKPSNVFLQSSTSVDKRACLIDLGIAKTDQDIQSRLTAAGKIMGSFSWMAPEVIRGEPATPRADLYSVALVLLHMLGVEQPHKRPSRAGEPEAEFLIRRGGRKPLKLSSLEGSEALPVGLREALSWALSPVPERRVDSARGLRVALRRAGFAARLSPITEGQGATPPKELLTPDAPRAYPEIIEAQGSKRDEIYQAALTRLHQRIEAQPRLRPIAAILAVVICSGLLAYFTTNGTPPPPVVLSITPPARAAAADQETYSFS
ncbi:serine/threonine protein kinase, partial [Myxococcota bacterium]|nr:serine/threonine protein kinase [Myxococcota bacterium]